MITIEKDAHDMNGLSNIDEIEHVLDDEEKVLVHKAPDLGDLHQRLTRVENVLKADLHHSQAMQERADAADALLKHLKTIGLENRNTQILQAAWDLWNDSKTR
jgi:hypothetical protein